VYLVKGNITNNQQNLMNLAGNTTLRIKQTRSPGYTRGGTRCLEGVSIPTNTVFWIYQRWDQVSRRRNTVLLIYQRWDQVSRKSPLAIAEVGSGVYEE
jgi:hypothetical protein